jgi:diacylglycerol O-acyltransferase
MHRLSGVDSLFVSLENRTNLFHVGAVSIFDPSTAPPGTPAPYEALRQVIQDRLHRVPAFRRRLVPVPGGLDHPRWVEDRGFDLDRHLFRVRLKRPVGSAQLASYAAEVLSRPLDRSRPLWEIHVIEGLEGDLVAGVAKIHHSVTDGVSGVEVTANLMDLTPEIAETPPPAEGWQAERRPSPARLMTDAVRHLMGAGPRAIGTAVRAASVADRIYARNRRPESVAPPAPFAGPRTSLSARVGSRRSIGMAQVDRAEVDQVRAATGATINDIILALTATMLRVYLTERNELPDRPLVAFVPKSVRAEGDTLETGVNKLSGMFVSLATNIDDPLLRLVAISQSASNAKEQDRILGPTLLGRVADLALPCVLGPVTRFASRTGQTSWRPPFSIVVSSFPGSPLPLYCAGGKMLAYHPFGPVLDGAALNVTAMSYGDQIGFGLLADRDAVPEVDVLARRLPEALNQVSKEVSG